MRRKDRLEKNKEDVKAAHLRMSSNRAYLAQLEVGHGAGARRAHVLALALGRGDGAEAVLGLEVVVEAAALRYWGCHLEVGCVESGEERKRYAVTASRTFSAATSESRDVGV